MLIKEAPNPYWIQTYTGRQYWPHSPSPADVDIEDIAHALSNLCRYTGHCARFYSVAEHSILVSKLVPPADALEALLHDATEAYLNDLSTPVKRGLPEYRELEARNDMAIRMRFQLPHEHAAVVKEADTLAYWTEREQLMLRHPAHEKPADLVLPIVGELGLDPPAAKALFLARYSAILATR